MRKLFVLLFCCICLWGCGKEETKETQISKLEEGAIDTETLKHYFKEIYENHNLNFISFDTGFSDNNFPYIEEIEYDYDTITIKGSIKQNSNEVNYYEEYDAVNNDLVRIHFIELTKNDDNFTNSLLAKISTMPSICDSYSCSLNINKALLRTDVEYDECLSIDNWCISPTRDDVVNTYFLTKQDT